MSYCTRQFQFHRARVQIKDQDTKKLKRSGVEGQFADWFPDLPPKRLRYDLNDTHVRSQESLGVFIISFLWQ